MEDGAETSAKAEAGPGAASRQPSAARTRGGDQDDVHKKPRAEALFTSQTEGAEQPEIPTWMNICSDTSFRLVSVSSAQPGQELGARAGRKTQELDAAAQLCVCRMLLSSHGL